MIFPKKIFTLFLLFFVAVVFVCVPVFTQAASPLVGYWKLDETAANSCSGGVNDACDSSGYGNDGAWTGNATASATVATTSFANPRSVTFDGAGDYIAVTNSSLLGISTITMCAWVRPTTVSASNYSIIFSTGDGTDGYDMYLYDTGSSFGLGTSYVSAGTPVGKEHRSGTGAMSAGAWHHVCATQNGAEYSNMKLYVDGSEDTNIEVFGTGTRSSDAGNAVSIGSQGAGDYPFKGNIDDLRVYNRVLSTTEISALAAGTHTSATWDGSSSAVFATGANWNTNAEPDPYTNITIADVATSDPLLAANTSLASLTINSGGILDSEGFNLIFKDSGAFVNNGTLRLKGDETHTAFTNDTDTGLIIYDGTTSITGLSAGNSYNDLTFDGSGGTWTLNAALDVNDDLTLTAGTLAVSGTNYGITVGGDWTDAGAGALTEGTGIVTFDGTGTLAANETFNSVTINSGGTVTLGADLAIASALTITSGTLSGSTYTITLSGTGTVFNNSGTYTAGSSTITLSDTSSTSKTFNGGGSTFNVLSITGAGTGAVIVQGSNTFATFTINPPKTVTFTSGTTQTITSSFGCTGTSGNVITINASGGTAATLSKSSGTVSCDYLSLTNSTATGGATWNPGNNSTNVSGNTGWNFDTTAPTVDAGSDQSKSAIFTQDATASDAGSGISTYLWSKTSGPGTITFGTETSEDTTITASSAGTYVLTLTVTDVIGNEGEDSFTLTWTVAGSGGSSNPSYSGGTPLVYPLGGGGSSSVIQEDPAMIEKLLKLIESLKKQIQDIINSGTQTPATTFIFAIDLNPGQAHPDVKRLQQFLNKNGFIISTTGPGSPNNETTLFGQNTKQALIKFQEAHKTEILTPQGLTQGNGRLGPGTRRYINGVK